MTVTTFSAEKDIICARGKSFDLSHANQVFRSIIAANAERYIKMKNSRTEKSIIIRLVAFELKMKNMRFIRPSKQGWKVLSEKEINLKIGHALRDVVPLQRKSEKRSFNKVDNSTSVNGTISCCLKKHTRTVSVGCLIDNDVNSDTSVYRGDKSATSLQVLPHQVDNKIISSDARRSTKISFNQNDIVLSSGESLMSEEELDLIYHDFVHDGGGDLLEFFLTKNVVEF